MTLISRIIQLVKADIHGIVDFLEDRELLLRQHLREMEDALAKKDELLNHMRLTRNRLKTERDTHHLEITKLDTGINAVLHRNRDDIARILLKKFRTINDHLDRLNHQADLLDQDIHKIENLLEKQVLIHFFD